MGTCDVNKWCLFHSPHDPLQPFHRQSVPWVELQMGNTLYIISYSSQENTPPTKLWLTDYNPNNTQVIIWFHVAPFLGGEGVWERVFLCNSPTCPGSSSCRPGRPWTHRDTSASDSQVFMLLLKCRKTRDIWIFLLLLNIFIYFWNY